jgi:hypothetical protein
MTEPPFHDLGPDESVLAGRWDGDDDTRDDTHSPHADPEMNLDVVEARIRWLVAHRLVALGSASDGWDWLFRDPADGRLWELTFPYGSLHGSGPRRLAVIDGAAATRKYGVELS